MSEHRPYHPELVPPPTSETGALYRGLLRDEALGSEASLLVARALTPAAAAAGLKRLLHDEAPALPEGGPHAALLARALSRVDWLQLADYLMIAPEREALSWPDPTSLTPRSSAPVTRCRTSEAAR